MAADVHLCKSSASAEPWPGAGVCPATAHRSGPSQAKSAVCAGVSDVRGAGPYGSRHHLCRHLRTWTRATRPHEPQTFFLHHGAARGTTEEDFPFPKISSVKWSSGMVSGTITVSLPGDSAAEIRNENRKDGKAITDRTRAVIARGVHGGSAAPQPAPAASTAQPPPPPPPPGDGGHQGNRPRNLQGARRCRGRHRRRGPRPCRAGRGEDRGRGQGPPLCHDLRRHGDSGRPRKGPPAAA
jgi:hypothetical protein